MVTKVISVALLLYPCLGLALSEQQQFRSVSLMQPINFSIDKSVFLTVSKVTIACSTVTLIGLLILQVWRQSCDQTLLIEYYSIRRISFAGV